MIRVPIRTLASQAKPTTWRPAVKGRGGDLLLVQKRCSKCGVEQATWITTTVCAVCGGSLETLSDKTG